MGNIFTIHKSIYKQFFVNMSDISCIINKKGYFTEVNNIFLEKTGYTLHEAKALHFLEYIHPEDRVQSIQHFKEALSGKFIKCKNRYITKNGNILLLEWTAVVDKYSKNVLCIARDITYSGLMKDEMIFYKNLLEESENMNLTGSWSWNISTNEIIWTTGLKRIYGLENPTYEQYMNMNHPEDRKFIQDTINKCIETKEPYHYKHRLIINDKIHHIYANGKYLLMNNMPYLQGIVRDITQDVELENKLREAKTIAEKASAMKSMFVANMSHEIRTPINGIIGAMTLIKDKNIQDTDIQEYLDIINYSSGVLLSVINNVLDFSKIESGEIKLEYNSIILNEFLTTIIHSFKNIIDKNVGLNMYIASNVPSSITSDRLKLRQILVNLISNSIKFTERGNISIFVYTKNVDIYFEVKDTGIGIPDDMIDKLFSPFTQVDISTTRKHTGTGLGLSICKNLVTLLKGEIIMTSKINIGTSVIFNIKNEYNQIGNNFIEIDTHTTEIVELDNTKKINILNRKVIIVEDNKINQIILKKTLEKLNYTNIIIYNSGKELINDLEIIRKSNISLIFMDLHMPGIDGYETTIKIRHAGIASPIIAVTANGISGESEKCMSVGMNDFILKPFHLNDLKNCIDKWMM